MRVQTSYVICTNPRSGSWLLSEGLACTARAGNPREWFNNAEEQLLRSQCGIECPATPIYSAYLAQVLERGTSPNGVFGIKLHYYQFAALPKKLEEVESYGGLALPDLLSAAFPNVKYLWLTRREKARQAISYYVAAKTDQWWSIDGAIPSKRPGSTDEPTFNPQAVERLEQILVQYDQNWQLYFTDNEITPLTICYEDLAADYSGSIRQVLKWLAIPDAETVPIAPPRLKRQSDSRTEEWLERYLAFKAGREHRATSSPAASGAGSDGQPIAVTSPLFVRSRKTHETVPDPWKRWIGEHKLLKTPDESIIAVLARNGYSHELAAAEVARADSDPYLSAGEPSQQRLNKVLSLLNTLRTLASLHPQANVVERRSNVSRDEFLEKYYAANRPVILQGLMRDWRAMTFWTPEYLKNKAGDEPVEITAGRDADPHYELNSVKLRRMVRFGDYVDMVYSGNVSNDYYLVANNTFFQRPAGRALIGDIGMLTEYLEPTTVENQSFLWFGPAGTVTPLHHDTSNILMSQVMGRKHIKLIPATHWQYVYNEIGVFSRVDCEKPDLERWPLFRHATILDVVLEPGEVLFLPVGWWHHVRTVEVSMMISFTNFLFPNHYQWATPRIRR